MLRRTLLRGFLQGDVLAPLVFVLILCVPQVLSQSPGNPTIVAPSSALEGSTVNFTCSSIGGNPLPAVTWYRGNTIVDQTYDTSTVGSVTVTTNNFQFTVYRNDSGVSYRCEVNNVNLGSPLTKTWYMTIYVQPGAPTISGPSVVTAGSTYTHRCVTSSGGIPVPTLAWKLGTQSLDNLGISNQVTTLSDNTNIVENNVTWVPVASDNGKTLSCELSHNETLGTSKLTDSIVMTVQVLPNISTTVTSYSRTVGTSVTLQCSILAASPSVTSVYWTRLVNSQTTTISIDGSKYTGSSTSNPSLTINPLATTDAGVYTCNAVNSAGTGSGQGILLSVSGSLPTVSIPFNAYTVNVGSSITMVCNVASSLTVTSVRWERNTGTGFSQVVTGSAGGNRFSGSTISSPSLILNSAQISDQGSYKCLATNSAGTGESTVTSLSVQGNVPSIQTSQTSYNVNQGNTVTLVCSVSSSTSTPTTSVQWQRISGSTTSNVDLTQTSKYSGSTTSTPSLTIFNVQSADAGSYRCTATNAVGTGQGLTISLNVNVAPTVNLGQSAYSVNYGSSVTLVCSISSNSAILSVSWQQITSSGTTVTVATSNTNKYSGGTTSSPNLVIFNTDQNDAGSYRCIATSSAGTGQSNFASLTVVGNVPSVSITSGSSLSVAIGNSITLSCVVSSSPSATSVTWQRTSNGVTTTLSIAGNSRYSGGSVSSPSLTISNAQLSDEGNYQCRATNSAGTGSSGITFLDVTGNIPTVVTGNGATITIGNQVTITCTVSGSPTHTSVIWTREVNGVTTTLDIPANSRYNGGTVGSPSLTITNVQQSDEGNYRCSATNTVGTGQSSTTAFLDVQGGTPTVVIGSGSSPTVGTTATISCSVSGTPAVQSVSWERTTGGVTTTLNLGNTAKYSGGTTSNPSLTIFSVQNSDSGNYVCRATNSVGTSSSGVAVLNVVGSLPSISVPLGNYSVNFGSSITLQCTVNAFPSALSVTWKKTINSVTTDIVINSQSSGKYGGSTVTSPSLVIYSADLSDEASYVCTASNTVGTGSSSQVYLDVLASVPTVQIGSSTYTVNAGNTAQLVCSIISQNPSATSVTWQRLVNNVAQTIAITGRYSGGTTNNPSLTISNTVTSDEGTYYCYATNSIGNSQTVQTFLDIQSAPTVSIPSSSYPVSYNSNTTLICSVTSTPNATAVNWYRVVNNVDTFLSISGNSRLSGGTTSNPSLTVTFAIFSDEGSYKCEATNSVGTTRSTPTFLDVIGSSPNVSIPISSYSAVFGNSVTIACTVTANPSATSVSWQQIVNSQSTTINVNANPTKYSGSTTSTPSLTINSLVTADSGYYVCSATNAAGTTVSGQTYLNVTGTTPTVSANPTSYSQNYGTNATLQCSVSGNPSVNTVYWTKTRNGVTTNITTGTAQSSSKYSGVNTGNPSLQIISLTTTDGGTYVCFGVNSVGSSQSSAVTLNVIGDLPSVSIGQSSYSVTSGNSVTLNCSYTSTPSATGVSWQRTSNGVSTVLSTTGSSKYSGGTLAVPSLTVFSTTSTDEGFYTCSITNAIGTASSSSAFLDVVATVPSVSISAGSYSVNYGNSITIPCSVTSNPFQSSVYWQRTSNGATTTLSISGRYSGSTVNSPALIISGAVLSDAGSYVCFATNSAGTGSSNAAVLTVNGNAPTVNIPNTQYTVTHGTSISIPCFVSGSPTVTSISWVRIASGVTTTLNIAGSSGKYSGGTVNSPSLTVTNTNSNDEGTYRCSATNAIGTSQDSTFLDVQGNSPSVSITQSTYTINYGSSVTLGCTVSGSPSATSVQWYRVTNSGSSAITVGGSTRYSGSSTGNPSLTITNTVLSDEGLYQCTATNSVGTGTSSTTYLDVVGTSPSVSIPSSSYSVNYGSTITIPCSVSANPSATSVDWYKDASSSALVITGRYSGGTTTTPSLTISSAQLSEEGNYRCSATNAVGTSSSITTFLDVIGSVPSVTIGSAVTVTIGNNATIQCSYNANPSATAVAWERTSGGQTVQITIGGRFSGGSTSVPQLIITNAQSSDEGSYRCLVTNAVGQGQSGTVFLDVQGNIPSVSLGNNTYSVVTGQSVTIDCNVTATPTQTLVYWQVSDFPGQTASNITIDGQKYSGGTIVTPSLTITDANSTLDEGYYRCLSVNAAGLGQSNQAFLDVTGNVPTVTIPSNSYSAMFGNSTTIPCSIASNPSASSMRWEKTANSNTDILTTTNSAKYSGGTLNNPSLTINNLNFNDQATYRCVASNQVGDGFSIATFLTVQGNAPTVSIPLTSYSALIGTNIQFPCSISANPTTTSVYWIFNPSNSANNVQISQSTGRYTVSQATNSPALTITNVTFSDTGSYTCTAVNVVGTGTDTADFNVTGSSPSVSIAQSSYSVLTGNSITIPCTISATPAISTRYWIFDPSGTGNNVQISTSTGRYTLGANTNSPSLTISNAVTSDAGTYTCYATNLVGTTADSATLTLTGDEPNITISVTSYSVLLNANVTLTCEVPAAQPSVNSVAWRFRTQGSSSTSEIDIAGNPNTYSGGSLNTPSLTITQVGNDQEGYYICTATNLVGTGNGTEIFLNVSGSGPSVSIPSSSYSVLQTQTVSLQCNVNNASPQITAVTWYYSATNNNASPSVVDIAGNSRYTGGTTTSPSLNITNAQSGDAGYYRCSATNAVATATSGYTSLSVTGAIPSGTSISGDASQSVDQTNTLTLTCSASGDPTPTITWSFNGQTLSSTNGVYTKVNVQRADDGEYTCTATNSLGSQTDTVDVDVRFAPVATSSAVSINAATGSTQTLTCAVEANPGVTYQWTRNSQVVGTNSRTYSKTFGTGDFGDYICTATNTLGTATVTFTVSQSSAGASEASTAGGGLTTGEIAAIVLAVLLILLLIIVICICCCTHGVCGAICGKKKDPKGRVEPVKEKEVYKETTRHIEIPRFEEKPKVREHSAVSRRDVDVNVKRENDYDIVRYETVPPAYYGDTIIAVQDDVRPSPRPHRLPALTTTEYTYEEAERRRKHRRKKKKHRRRHDDEEVIVERVRTASPVRYVEEPAQDVIIETVRRSPSTRRKRSDEEEMIVRTPSRSPSRRRRHEERYVTTERVVNGDVYRDGGDLRAINGEVYRDSGEYTLSRHGSGRYTRESRSGRRKDYAGSTDVEVVEGSEYYVERR